jgi:hypothetical protein
MPLDSRRSLTKPGESKYKPIVTDEGLRTETCSTTKSEYTWKSKEDEDEQSRSEILKTRTVNPNSKHALSNVSFSEESDLSLTKVSSMKNSYESPSLETIRGQKLAKGPSDSDYFTLLSRVGGSYVTESSAKFIHHRNAEPVIVVRPAGSDGVIPKGVQSVVPFSTEYKHTFIPPEVMIFN